MQAILSVRILYERSVFLYNDDTMVNKDKKVNARKKR